MSPVSASGPVLSSATSRASGQQEKVSPPSAISTFPDTKPLSAFAGIAPGGVRDTNALQGANPHGGRDDEHGDGNQRGNVINQVRHGIYSLLFVVCSCIPVLFSRQDAKRNGNVYSRFPQRMVKEGLGKPGAGRYRAAAARCGPAAARAGAGLRAERPCRPSA